MSPRLLAAAALALLLGYILGRARSSRTVDNLHHTIHEIETSTTDHRGCQAYIGKLSRELQALQRALRIQARYIVQLERDLYGAEQGPQTVVMEAQEILKEQGP
jgi:hypothetical protein